MTVQELYDSIQGSYEDAKRILQMDKLIGKFIQKFPSDTSWQRLETAWKNGDTTGMFEAAHSMKGVCGNLGLRSLSEAASDVAENFRPGNTPEWDDAELDRRLNELKTAYEHTISQIQAFAAQ